MSATLLPDPSCLHLDCLSAQHGTIRLTLTATADAARCPLCHHATSRVHSRYSRTLADLPWLGVPVTIRLTLRRFICANATCERRIFAERLPSVVAPYVRRTLRCTEVMALIGFIAGGEPGARLLAGLAMPHSPDTILRAIRQAILPPTQTPRVLGVDDFAFRRGCKNRFRSGRGGTTSRDKSDTGAAAVVNRTQSEDWEEGCYGRWNVVGYPLGVT